MAGIVTTTELTWKSIKKVTFDWQSSGDVASATTSKYYDGEVLRIVAIGSHTSTGYTLAINDSGGVDLLGGRGILVTSGGADYGTSTGAAQTGPSLSVVCSKISLAVTGSCGDASTGQAIVYIR